MSRIDQYEVGLLLDHFVYKVYERVGIDRSHGGVYHLDGSARERLQQALLQHVREAAAEVEGKSRCGRSSLNEYSESSRILARLK